MAKVQTIEELIARNFAADVANGQGVTPEEAPAVKRPLPPVGHFGYTEEDAEAIRQENADAGATLDTSETKWEVGDDREAGDPRESAESNRERAELAAEQSARSERAAREDAQSRPEVVGGRDEDSGRSSNGQVRQRAARNEDDASSSGAAKSSRQSSRSATDKNRQQAPAAQSRSGAESKGDDGDNTNNPRDESDKK